MVKQNKIISMMIVLVCSINLVHSHFGGPVQVGKCPKIPGVGDGVLMIGHAHKHIVDALNDKNPNTAVKMIYRNDVQSTAENNHATTYTLGFQIETYSGKQFAFLEFESQNNGIGSMRLEKAILTNSLTVVAKCFTLTNFDISNYTPIECGNLKSIFSGYGTDPTAELAYAFAGRNQNSISTQLLSGLSPQTNSGKFCIASNYESYNILGTAANDFTNNVFCNRTGLGIVEIEFECLADLTLTNCVVTVAANSASFSSPTSVDCSGCTTVTLSKCDVSDASSLTSTLGSDVTAFCDGTTLITTSSTCLAGCVWDPTVADSKTTAAPTCTAGSDTVTGACPAYLKITSILPNGDRQVVEHSATPAPTLAAASTKKIIIQEGGTVIIGKNDRSNGSLDGYFSIESLDKDNTSLEQHSCGTPPSSLVYTTIPSDDFLGLNAITFETSAVRLSKGCINTINALEYL